MKNFSQPHTNALNDARFREIITAGSIGESPKKDGQFLFGRFLADAPSGKGLHLQFDMPEEAPFGDNWLAIDLESVERRAGESGNVLLELEDEYFDKVYCSGIDRVSRPSSLIWEIRRTLKRSGQVWAQGLLSAPSSREAAHGTMSPYWHFTPRGFQVLFERFDEIRCSVCDGSSPYGTKDSFFYGLKPQLSNQSSDERQHRDRPMPSL